MALQSNGLMYLIIAAAFLPSILQLASYIQQETVRCLNCLQLSSAAKIITLRLKEAYQIVVALLCYMQL
jgi:hypothetical protein